ncbi:PadR family transcriptional regulator [Herbihabitans rhizosphaerae]|uniref:PadR family transcriptional regulator n=2 Tax=Herbihabitans rhizosphaerae TaxID=1872711 RepID=A0A4V2ESW2_9PSEU|nr:PadR family transcriptional regulator [Herbihabitans rhizosphaerae]
MTTTTRAVVEALLAVFDEKRTEGLYGLQIAEITGLLPGTTYPILQRLLALGWVVDETEDIDPVREKRPRRRLYRLTPGGVEAARSALDLADARRASPRARLRPVEGTG